MKPTAANDTLNMSPPANRRPQEYVASNPFILKRKSIEYALVLFYIFFINYLMFTATANASKRVHETIKYDLGEPMEFFKNFGSLGIDQADHQWRDFVKNFGLLGPGFFFFALIGRGIRTFMKQEDSEAILPIFYCCSGLGFSYYIHGHSVLFMLGLMVINYFCIAKLHDKIPYAAYMLLMWVAHVSTLFINDHYDGYRFASIHPSLWWMDGGGIIRWHIIFNMATLRMIAFNYDMWEARFHGQETRDRVLKKHRDTCPDCAAMGVPCYKLRTEMPHPVSSYNIVTYFAYLLYIPLFIGGPMSSFNAFVSHIKLPQQSFHFKKYFLYFIRIVGLFATITFMLHFIHLNAIRKHSSIFPELSIPEKVAFLHSALGFLWLKFNIIWKFFRLMGLIDGVEAPEDMQRCYSNTVTVQSFWRDWHASFNAWIVRYMYVPLGGSKSRLWSIFVIFGFIALWHDIKMQLFMWALVMCVAFVPEIIVTSFFYGPKFKAHRQKWYWRYVRAIGGTSSTTGLVAANLVGFGAGTENTSEGFSHLVTKEAWILGAAMIMYFFCAGTVGIRDRDMEREEQLKQKAKYGLLPQKD